MKFYSYCLTSFILCLVFIFLVFMLSYFLGNSVHSKSSPFECGFQPFTSMGVPFSMPFFLVSLMFLLFDVEILLVCLMPLLYSFGGLIYLYSWGLLFFILMATLYEWVKGTLEWF